MTPERTEAFARLITDFCQEARQGDVVLVEACEETWTAGERLAAVLQERGADAMLLDLTDERIRSESLWNGLTGYVSLRTISSRRTASDTISPLIRQLRMTLRKTSTYLPDALLAGRAGMTLEQLHDYYAGLLYLDAPQPEDGFHELRDRQDRLLTILRGASSIRIQGDRTDLALRTDGRRWVNSYGRRNIPSGEMYTSPLEDSADGIIHFDVPSYNFGEPVKGVTLEFHAGKVVSARADVGNEILQQKLSMDQGASRLGELGIGGNNLMTRFLGATLFDEKVAGTVHLALGKGYPQTGGINDSALHWDLIKNLRQGGLVTVDGRPFIEDGSFSDA